MSGEYEILSKIVLIGATFLFFFAGVTAFEKNYRLPGVLIFVGALMSLICYALIWAGQPIPPEHSEVIHSAEWKIYTLKLEIRNMLIPLGHFISAAGVVSLVLKANT